MNPLHDFENTGSVISQFIHPTLAPIRKRQILYNFIDYAGRVTGKTLPFSLGLLFKFRDYYFLYDTVVYSFKE